MGVSVDGFVAGPGDTIDWTVPDAELHQFHNDRVRAQGAQICGRKLYETMRLLGDGRPGPVARLRRAGVRRAVAGAPQGRVLLDADRRRGQHAARHRLDRRRTRGAEGTDRRRHRDRRRDAGRRLQRSRADRRVPPVRLPDRSRLRGRRSSARWTTASRSSWWRRGRSRRAWSTCATAGPRRPRRPRAGTWPGYCGIRFTAPAARPSRVSSVPPTWRRVLVDGSRRSSSRLPRWSSGRRPARPAGCGDSSWWGPPGSSSPASSWACHGPVRSTWPTRSAT